MEYINNGVTAAKGFSANGIHCGIRKNKTKLDLALIVSEVICTTASVYTTNLVQGSTIKITKKNSENGYAQAIICNSGNANTCNANGIEIAEAMCNLVEEHTGINASDVVIASTGVIGQKLDITPIANGMEELVVGLGQYSDKASQAIMTTDTVDKNIAVEFEIDGVKCVLGGIAKGSGMIHPNMATMLVFVTTDVNISSKMLKKALSTDVKTSFNMISIDGDTSTNDMVSVLANGLAGNQLIDEIGDSYNIFCEALNSVTTSLCKAIASDGEGASKLIECNVLNAKDTLSAQKIAKSVVCSNLLKCAIFGADANWGRVLCAIGYSGAEVDVEVIDVSFVSEAGYILVCENGSGIDFSENLAKKILSEQEINIIIDIKQGDSVATAWGCDLTYDYVKINGDYRT